MTKAMIFLDVDGTLVTYENELPSSAVEAIHQAQENGHKVFTVTGRSKAEMYQEILDIGFDGYIGGNGNYVELGEEVIFHKTLSADQTKAIVDWLQEKNLEFYLESNSGLYASEKFEERGKETMKAYTAYKGKPDAEDVTVRSIFPEMIFGASLYRDDINKISFILDDYQDYLDAKEAFPNLKAGTWGGVGEKALFGDLALDNIDKATGIDALLKRLNRENNETYAFGDAKIDIPMLEYSQVGVALGNGGPEIKAMADYVTDAVEDDGLAKAFKHFKLI